MKKRIKTTVIISALSLALTACSQQTSSPDHSQQPKHNNETDQQKKQSNHSANENKNTSIDQDKSAAPADNTASGDKKTSNSTVHVDQNPNSTLVLVNKTHKLPDGFIPPNLVVPDVPFPYSVKSPIEKMHMQKVAATALEQLFEKAKQDGILLYAQSGYRSYTRQKVVFASNVKKLGEEKASIISAHPGTSEHQTGLAMDISSADIGYELIQDFGQTKEGKWVAANAANFGFIIRYPKGKQSITGYEYEPWHLRYVGVQAATYIYDHHLTLEEYIAQKG